MLKRRTNNNEAQRYPVGGAPRLCQASACRVLTTDRSGPRINVVAIVIDNRKLPISFLVTSESI